jgi:hypothetical protein
MDSLRAELLHDGSNVRVTMVQMPALNTPQFGWVRSRLSHKAQPVPPIYQPEVAAEAILWAARHDRREVLVALPTVEAVIGNNLVPGLADRYLARTGYTGQQTEEPEDPNRPDNLLEPVPGDHGAHGAFGDMARDTSAEFWFARNRNQLMLAGAALAALAGTALVRR